MTDFYVRNSLNYNKTVKFNITLRYFVPKGEKGDYKWILEIGTTYPDVNGDPISSKKIHAISADNFDEIIEDGLADLCSQIDWLPLSEDKESPYISSETPSDGDTDVNIYSNIIVNLEDALPSAGMDLSSMKVILNNSMVDFDITNEVEVDGDPYEYELKWIPPLRVFDTYN